MSTIPGLFVIGEANFSDHGANRLGASALMQGLSDGYFVIPYTLGNYLASDEAGQGGRASSGVPGSTRVKLAAQHEAAAGRPRASGRWIPSIANSARSCGTTAAWRATRLVCDTADRPDSRTARGVLGERQSARRTGKKSISRWKKRDASATSWSSAELMCMDALEREESCGGHFREEHQTPDGEALRDDEDFSYVAAWEYAGEGASRRVVLHKETAGNSSTCIRRSGATNERHGNASHLPHLAAEGTSDPRGQDGPLRIQRLQ